MVAKKTAAAPKAAPKTVKTPAKPEAAATETQPPFTFDVDAMTETYRQFADKGIAQAQETFEKFQASSQEASKAVEESLETAKTGGFDLGLKTADALRGNVDTSFAFFEKLMGVKSTAEVIELQTTFFREQTEAATAQLKAFQEASTKLAEDIVTPVKTNLEKNIKDFGVA